MRAVLACAAALALAVLPAADDVQKDFDGWWWNVGFRGQRVGDLVAFTLPPFDNRQDEPETIRSVRLVEVPPGWTVLGYGLMRRDGPLGTGWGSRNGRPGDPYDPRPLRPIAGYTVGPHREADHYGVVLLRIDKLPLDDIEGVETLVSYGGSTRWQRAAATFGADDEPV